MNQLDTVELIDILIVITEVTEDKKIVFIVIKEGVDLVERIKREHSWYRGWRRRGGGGSINNEVRKRNPVNS